MFHQLAVTSAKEEKKKKKERKKKKEQQQINTHWKSYPIRKMLLRCAHI